MIFPVSDVCTMEKIVLWMVSIQVLLTLVFVTSLTWDLRFGDLQTQVNICVCWVNVSNVICEWGTALSFHFRLTQRMFCSKYRNTFWDRKGIDLGVGVGWGVEGVGIKQTDIWCYNSKIHFQKPNPRFNMFGPLLYEGILNRTIKQEIKFTCYYFRRWAHLVFQWYYMSYMWLISLSLVFTGSQYGLSLSLNIEQYEHTVGASSDAGIKVCRGQTSLGLEHDGKS